MVTVSKAGQWSVRGRAETTFTCFELRKHLADQQVHEDRHSQTLVLAQLGAKPLTADKKQVCVSFNSSMEEYLLETYWFFSQLQDLLDKGESCNCFSLLFSTHYIFSNVSREEWSCRKTPEDDAPLCYSPCKLYCTCFSVCLVL